MLRRPCWHSWDWTSQTVECFYFICFFSSLMETCVEMTGRSLLAV